MAGCAGSVPPRAKPPSGNDWADGHIERAARELTDLFRDLEDRESFGRDGKGDTTLVAVEAR